uniref:Phospholipase A2 n=1 Tax=Anser brachyrhynchus TaxID=132585 RepID=A0A8B9CV67_9AVES
EELSSRCGLSGLLPARGSVLELERMIKAVTGKSALLSYSWYGCFCGIGGRGTPVDATDRCCQLHDTCYDGLLRHRCNAKKHCLLHRRIKLKQIFQVKYIKYLEYSKYSKINIAK